MKESVLAIAFTGVVAVGAGVAIAGLPSGRGAGDLVLSAPRTTVDDLGPDEQPPASTAPDPTNDVEPATTTSSTTTSTTSTTTSTSTTTEPPVVLREPAELVIATANASAISGVATRTAEALSELGYEASPVDAEGSNTSAVYFLPGFEAEAAKLAQEIGWTIGDIGPMAEMPPLQSERIFQLVVLIGVDRA